MGPTSKGRGWEEKKGKRRGRGKKLERDGRESGGEEREREGRWNERRGGECSLLVLRILPCLDSLNLRVECLSTTKQISNLTLCFSLRKCVNREKVCSHSEKYTIMWEIYYSLPDIFQEHESGLKVKTKDSQSAISDYYALSVHCQVLQPK